MMNAGITLPQVLLVSHVERRGAASPSELAEAMHASLPATSQMIDRLVQQGMLHRSEDPVDRRRKTVTTTPAVRAFLRELRAARSADYDVGLATVTPELRARLVALLERVVAKVEAGRENGPVGRRPSTRGEVG
jgi:DNA-binding MarR family transcriptional regulator